MNTGSPTCVVVADQAEARIYLMRGASLRLAAALENPSAHLHDRDLKSDRPGRVFDRAPPARGRRGAVGHHSTGGERKPRRQLAAEFARSIATAAAANRRESGFDRLVLVAGPRLLGQLRRALPAGLRTRVAAEVAKDWVHLPAATLRVRVTSATRRAVRRP
ncbi:MAG TPA: host attachment protein [Steroidobacteraceae bacterium]|jgi:protein required for attachment to host cells